MQIPSEGATITKSFTFVGAVEYTERKVVCNETPFVDI
jgi:hypothetical protein